MGSGGVIVPPEGYLAIGAMIYSDRIHDVIAGPGKDRWYTSGFTYSGHPVSSAAALKNIEIMKRDRLPERAREIGAYFEQRLQTLYDLPIVGDVRGCKMMMCVENVANKETRALLPDEVNIGKRISDAAEKLGLIVRPIGHLNVMSPARIVSREDVDYIVENLGQAITQVSNELDYQGQDSLQPPNDGCSDADWREEGVRTAVISG